MSNRNNNNGGKSAAHEKGSSAVSSTEVIVPDLTYNIKANNVKDATNYVYWSKQMQKHLAWKYPDDGTFIENDGYYYPQRPVFTKARPLIVTPDDATQDEIDQIDSANDEINLENQFEETILGHELKRFVDQKEACRNAPLQMYGDNNKT